MKKQSFYMLKEKESTDQDSLSCTTWHSEFKSLQKKNQMITLTTIIYNISHQLKETDLKEWLHQRKIGEVLVFFLLYYKSNWKLRACEFPEKETNASKQIYLHPHKQKSLKAIWAHLLHNCRALIISKQLLKKMEAKEWGRKWQMLWTWSARKSNETVLQEADTPQ